MGATSPVYFGWRNRNLLAYRAKQRLIYLMDADKLGGGDHQTTVYTSPRLGNDRAACCEGLGIWGGLSTFRDVDGQIWLLAPMGVRWRRRRNSQSGRQAGKELYNSGEVLPPGCISAHWRSLNGKVFAVDRDSNVYSFGRRGNERLAAMNWQ